jgi:signal transduction histidine kinase
VLPGREDPLRYRLLGAGAVLLLGLGHGVHDLLEGHAAGPAFLPSVSIALQVATLSLGHEVSQRRGWSQRKALGLAILVSLIFGYLSVSLHSRPAVVSVWKLGYWVLIVGISLLGFWLLMFYFPAQLSEARTRALAAEGERQKAELARLRSNFHPHFLLNTLNAVAGLLVSEPRQARQLVVALGDLLRDSLEDGEAMQPLGQEVEWLRRYAEIFEIRYRGAIHFRWDLPVDTLTMPIPRLLLQPLLENAIEHGALRRVGGGTVTVSSRASARTICVAVSDDGPGMSGAPPSGLGLRLVRDRLERAYPTATMSIESSSAGASVSFELPRVERAR